MDDHFVRVHLACEFERDVLDSDLAFADSSYADGAYVLVDGERWPLLDGSDLVGMPPQELLASRSVTAPAAEPKTIVLGRCTCGEIGCGCLSARCYLLDDETVVWDVFRSDPGPPIYTKPRPNPGALVFDRKQYDSAIAQARANHELWKRPR